MNTLIRQLLISSLFFFSISTDIQAAHLIGGTLSYECLGGNNYRFTLTAFRDCAGGGALFDSDPQAPFMGTVSAFVGTGQMEFANVILPPPMVEPIDPPVGCQSPATCLEKGTYVFELELPATNEPFHLVYQRCCRPANVSNIEVPGEVGMTFTVTISPEAKAVCNNSPVFDDPMICSFIGLSYSFEHAVMDTEGDSLVYAFCSPYLGGGNVVVNPAGPDGVAPDPDLPPPYNGVEFKPNYSETMPIPGDPIFEINHLTGEVNATPNQVGTFLYGVCVQEFRNGIFLGETRFEFNHAVFLEPLPVGVHENNLDRLEIYPNPVNDILYLKLPGQTEIHKACILNVNGNEVQEFSFDHSGLAKIDVSGLSPNLYLISVVHKNGAYVEKLAVKKN